MTNCVYYLNYGNYIHYSQLCHLLHLSQHIYINALISHFSLWQVFLVLGPVQGGLSFPGQVI